MDDQLHVSSDGLRFSGHISVFVNRSGPGMDGCILKLKASDNDGSLIYLQARNANNAGSFFLSNFELSSRPNFACSPDLKKDIFRTPTVVL
jgi:hypothetical protein